MTTTENPTQLFLGLIKASMFVTESLRICREYKSSQYQNRYHSVHSLLGKPQVACPALILALSLILGVVSCVR